MTEFGSGHLSLDRVNLLTTSRKTQAEIFGYQLGCPSVPEIIFREGESFMAKRYFQLILYYGIVVDEIRQVRPDLLGEIEASRERLEGEPLAVYDPHWIPKENLKVIPGTETPGGYALPRLLLYFGSASSIEPTNQRMLRGLDYFTDTLKELSPEDDIHTLMVKFAEKLANNGMANKVQILRHTISAGKLKQDSFHTYFKDIVSKMKEHAPLLWDTYSQMSSEKRLQNKIADITV